MELRSFIVWLRVIMTWSKGSRCLLSPSSMWSETAITYVITSFYALMKSEFLLMDLLKPGEFAEYLFAAR